jgi:hypothetical protein
MELRPEKACSGDTQQKLKTADPNFSSERTLHINKSINVYK